MAAPLPELSPRPTPTAGLMRHRAHFPGWVLILAGLVTAALAPRTDGGYLRALADFSSEGLNTSFLALGIIALLVFAYAARSRAAFQRVAVVMLTETALVHLIKFTTGNLLGLFPRPSGGAGGFPSGHAAAACALAYVLTDRWPRGAPLWYALAALITWSRWEAGAHYPYQMVGGAVLGTVVAAVLVHRFHDQSRERGDGSLR